MNYFKRSNILWGLFVAVGAILLGIVLWTPSVGGTLLDSLSAVSEVQALLEKMTKAQKDSHFLMTLLLDMPYPFIAVCKLVKYTFPSQFFEQAMPGVLNKPEHRYIYGSFLAGITLKFFGQAGNLLAIPALVAVPTDLLENVIQLLALKGNEALLPLKAFLTPAKFILVGLAVLIALAALVNGIISSLRHK